MEKLRKGAIEIWKRISNWRSLMGIASALIIISKALKLPVDYVVFQSVVEGILTIFVIIGIIGKEGMETTKWNK